MCASATADLFCDLRHSLLQVVILLGQRSVLLEQRLADPGSQLQISLFLLDGEEEGRHEVLVRRCGQWKLMHQRHFDATNHR